MCQLSSVRTNRGLVSLPGFVQLLHKTMNAKTVEAVGINRFKILVIGNIDMFYHPKYYKELRKRNKSDQTISLTLADGCNGSVRSGPGQTRTSSGSSLKRQAAGDKLHTASSAKRQASSPE